jgi:putative membrane protein
VHDALIAFHPWTKSLHIISMVAWMAGLFYLPRLFVYHAESAPAGSQTSETFKIMEAKLLRLIMNPAMIATWVFGLLLLATPGVISWATDIWIYLKLAMVTGLTWFHHWLALRRKDFLREENTRTGRQYRISNEVPTAALVFIVIMVVVRPF